MHQDQKRKDEEIIESILLTIKRERRSSDPNCDEEDGGSTKSKITHDTFLSDKMANYYLELMVNSNLVSYIPGSGKYRLTCKGEEYLTFQ